MRPELEIQTVNCRIPFSHKELRQFVKKLLLSFPRKAWDRGPLAPGQVDLNLVFVTRRQSQLLNNKYRSKNYPTDVLSFSGDGKEMGLGELILCLEVLKRQAKEQGHSLKKEVQTMIIHGFLHLLGYDHEKSQREELKMFKLQDKLLSKLSK